MTIRASRYIKLSTITPFTISSSNLACAWESTVAFAAAVAALGAACKAGASAKAGPGFQALQKS